MKIVFVIQKLAGLKGGAERMIVTIANAMAARGFEVEILTFEMRRGTVAYALEPSVRVVNLFPFHEYEPQNPDQNSGRVRKTGHKPYALERLIKSVPNVFPVTHLKWYVTHGFFAHRLEAYFQRERPDVAVALLRPAITATAIAGKKANVPVIASTHNTPWQDYDNSNRWDQNPVYAHKSREAFDLVDRIFVLLPEFCAWFPEQLHKKIEVMPNPVARVSPLPEKSATRQKIILGVGRLTTIKRYDLLIKAWAKLTDRYPDWRIKIFGEGDEQARLLALINELGLEKCVSLAGVTDEIGDEYDRAAILCHPAEFEGFGLSVAEALAHGLPVIGFADCSGVNTLVHQGENGILVPAGANRVDGLAKALEHLITTPEMRLKMSEQSPVSISQFAPKLIYDRWEATFKRL